MSFYMSTIEVAELDIFWKNCFILFDIKSGNVFVSFYLSIYDVPPWADGQISEICAILIVIICIFN